MILTCLLNTVIEEHNLNGIGKVFHNKLPLYLIYFCPQEVLVLNKCKFWLDLVL